MDQLTTFADYRVPQILRNLGVMVYTCELCKLIDSYILIESGSEYEVEIRAATVVAVEKLHQILVEKGFTDLKVIEIDWLLWQKGETVKDNIEPHHRTLTIFY